MSVPPSQGFLQGLRNTRQAQGDGTLQGRVRSAMPASARPVGGRQEAMSKAAGPSVRVDTLTLTAISQSIAATADDIVWTNELVGLTPREGFNGYGGTPTDTVTIPADGRLLTTLTLKRATATAWTIRWHVTRGADTLTYDMAAGSSTDAAIAEAPPFTVKSGDVLRVRILQSSGGAETLDSATLHMTLINVSPRMQHPPGCAIAGTATVAFAAPGTIPRSLTFDGTDLWNSDVLTDTIYRLSTANGTVLQSFAAPGTAPHGLAWDGTHLWNVDFTLERVYRINPADGTIVADFASPATAPRGLTFDGTDLWISNGTSGSGVLGNIYRVSTTGTLLQSFAAPGEEPTDLAWDGTHLWVTDSSDTVTWHTDPHIYRIDPADGTVLQKFRQPHVNPSGLTFDTAHGCRLWHCDYDTDSVYTIV